MDGHQSNTTNEPTRESVASTPTAGSPALRKIRRQVQSWFGTLISAAIFLGVGLVLIAALGAAQRFGWIQSGQCNHGSQTADAGKSDVVYFCPMMCTPLRQSTPGRCPTCAMDLVPMKSGGGKGPQLSVEIDSAARRLANIQTAPVVSKRVERTIRSVGKLAFDESRQATISAYVDGRIDKLHVDYSGTQVQKGEHMALLYSPDLYSAQVEYLLSRKSDSTTSPSSILGSTIDLSAGAREKLIDLGMTAEQISQLEKRKRAEKRTQICAPIGGTVVEKLKQEGDYVKTGQAIYRIADLSIVWLILELFPEDASQIRYGQKVEAAVQSLPGEVFVGRVAFVDPFVSEKTRTVRVRVELLNPGRRLRPGDYATANVRLPVIRDGAIYIPELAGKWISPRHPQVICAESGVCPLSGKELVPTTHFGYASVAPQNENVLVVPRNAVLMAGEHSIVYVETKPGRFAIRRITLGPLTEQEAVVFRGLKDGDKVVTSGNFLIDSQMQLAGNPSIIDPTGAEFQKSAAPQHQSGPLKLQIAGVRPFGGEAGTQLDELYTAYFAIQSSLSRDKRPNAEHVRSLQSAARQLTELSGVSDVVKTRVSDMAMSAAELLDGDLKTVRKNFKPVSHAVVHLSAIARGPKTSDAFTQFHCPMVPGGGGDWLQASGSLANPYFGSEMLRCGKKIREFGAKTSGPQMPTPDRTATGIAPVEIR